MKVEPMPLIIIVSAVSEPSIIQRALTLVAKRYIVKLFDFNLFFKEVSFYLNMRMIGDLSLNKKIKTFHNNK